MSESQQTQQDMEALMQKTFRGEITLADEMKLEKKDMDALYVITEMQLQAGKYEDAFRMFNVLCMLNPQDPRFLFGGAMARQKLGDYTTASIYYYLAAVLDYDNPTPMLHLSECLMALKDKEIAKNILQQTVELAEKSAEYATISQRAKTILENLEA